MSKLDCHIHGVPVSFETHAHEYAHILLPLKDELVVRIGGEDHHITHEHLAFVEPNRIHLCVCSSDIIMINIPESMIKKEDVETLASKVCLPLTGPMLPLSELIKSEVQRNPDSDSIRYLYYYLYDKLVEVNGFKSLNYIRDNFAEEISIAELARMENYNISYFTDWFKKQTGSSPSSYIRRLRIEKAKELLTSTNYRLIDVAAQVGFSGNASFSRAFRECCGISPTTYRQSRKNA